MSRSTRIPAVADQLFVALLMAPPAGTAGYSLLLGGGAWVHNLANGQFPDAAAAAGSLPVALIGSMVLGTLVGVWYAYGAMLVFGLPIWGALHWAHAESLRNYALAGAACGALIPPIFAEPAILHNGLAGALVMAAFWLILVTSRRINPDDRIGAARDDGGCEAR
jgi:hypothetical protein